MESLPASYQRRSPCDTSDDEYTVYPVQFFFCCKLHLYIVYFMFQGELEVDLTVNHELSHSISMKPCRQTRRGSDFLVSCHILSVIIVCSFLIITTITTYSFCSSTLQNMWCCLRNYDDTQYASSLVIWALNNLVSRCN